MLKPVVAAAAVLAIAGSSFVYAQQRSDGPGVDGGSRLEQRQRPSLDDIHAFADARIAALKAGLQLTPEQERNWPAFEQAVRDLVKLRVERRQTREAAGEQQPSANPFDRLQRRADAMSQFGAALKQVAEAGAPLYQSLDEAQKHRFTLLARFLRPHHMAAGYWRRGEFGGHDDVGPGGYFEHRGGGPDGTMDRDWDHGGPHGMMGRDWDSGAPHGMMGRNWHNSAPHGMTGGDQDEDSDL